MHAWLAGLPPCIMHSDNPHLFLSHYQPQLRFVRLYLILRVRARRARRGETPARKLSSGQRRGVCTHARTDGQNAGRTAQREPLYWVRVGLLHAVFGALSILLTLRPWRGHCSACCAWLSSTRICRCMPETASICDNQCGIQRNHGCWRALSSRAVSMLCSASSVKSILPLPQWL